MECVGDGGGEWGGVGGVGVVGGGARWLLELAKLKLNSSGFISPLTSLSH